MPNPDEARYRTLVRAISQIVWTTPPSGEFTEVDPAWTEYTGQTSDEAMGWGWLDAVHPEDRVRVRQLWKRALDTKSFYHIEHRLRRRDGMHRWVAARAAPVFSADGSVREWVGTYSDVDEMRRASEERARLFQAERRARADAERLSEQLTDTIESIAEPFVAFDREWRIVRMNGASRRVLRGLGVNPDLAVGQVIWHLIPGLESERIGDELHRAARERQAVQFIYEWQLTGHWLEVHVYPTRDGLATYALDVTERVRAEETLRFLADASRVLASSLDYATTLQTVAQLAVPFLADYCIVDLIEKNGTVRRLATAHVDPAKQPLLEAIKQYPPILTSDNFVATVLRTGRAEIAPDASNLDVAVSSAGRPELMRIVRELGPRSYLCVPLIINDRVLGSILCVSTSDARRYGESDVAVAEELGRRAVVAVEHARLHQAERVARVAAERATSRLREAQEISAAAQAAESLEQMLTTLVERVRVAIQTDTATVLLLGEDGETLAVGASLGLADVEHGARMRIGEGFSGRVAALREAIVSRDATVFDEGGAPLQGRVRSIVGVPLLAAGRLVGVLHAGTFEEREFGDDDVRLMTLVADRVAQAIERERLFELERQARASAEKANRAKMDFLAMMSYELRTPLNAIAGYAELLELGLRGPVTEQQVKDLQSIHRNERHLLALIDEVLSFAKLDAGRVELDVREVRVRPAIESVTSIVTPQMHDKGIAFAHDEIDAGLLVFADLEKLQQIIGNLLSNAIKFTDRGGRIAVGANATGREVTIRVRDTGVGIARDQHHRIFEPFVRLDGGLTRRSSGTGLGLSISRELARAMRGELSVNSEEGAGAEFVLSLPRAKVQ